MRVIDNHLELKDQAESKTIGGASKRKQQLLQAVIPHCLSEIVTWGHKGLALGKAAPLEASLQSHCF